MLQLEDMSEADKIFNFEEGLKKGTRGEVRYRNPLTLDDAIDIAMKFDDAHYPDQGKNFSNSSHGSKYSKREEAPSYRKDHEDH